jgi:hypothetical protein
MHLRRLSDILGPGRGGTCRVKGIGPALQLGTAPLLDLVRAGREPGEEGIDGGADRVRRAKTGGGGDLRAHPSRDVLGGVENRCARNCCKKETEVAALLVPLRGRASTSPVSRQTAA